MALNPTERCEASGLTNASCIASDLCDCFPEEADRWGIHPEYFVVGLPTEGDFRFCVECDVATEVVDEFDDQLGFEEQARPVHVVALDCGHDIVTTLRSWPT